MTEPVSDSGPENIYRGGYFPALRERLREAGRYVRQLVLDPGVAIPRAWRQLKASLARDAALFGGIFRFFTRGIANGVRNPKHRRWIIPLFALAGFAVTMSWQRCGIMGCPDVGRLARLQPGGNALVLDARGAVIADLS